MTIERKMAILEQCKIYFESSKPWVGICSVFWRYCTPDELIDESGGITTIQFYLGDIFLKHKPKDKTAIQLFFPCTFENIPKRIEIIDKMILELKSQIKP